MIEIEHLSKRYGEHPAVSDLSVTIESGQIYGFLGPNGAGKSNHHEISWPAAFPQRRGMCASAATIFLMSRKKAKRLIGYLPSSRRLSE